MRKLLFIEMKDGGKFLMEKSRRMLFIELKDGDWSDLMLSDHLVLKMED